MEYPDSLPAIKDLKVNLVKNVKKGKAQWACLRERIVSKGYYVAYEWPAIKENYALKCIIGWMDGWKSFPVSSTHQSIF